MNNIGDILKKLREENGLKGNDVVEKLKELGIEISVKTLYGYESGRNSTNADMFLALCQIYKCKNIMEVFSNSVDDVLFTNKEWEMIEKYRDLDLHGRKMVDFTLNEEWERSKEIKKSKIATLAVNEDAPDYLKPQAAHNDSETAEELSLMQEDVENLQRPF